MLCWRQDWIVGISRRTAAEAGAPGRVRSIVADVTKEKDCRRVVAVALNRFGRLDVLVNNAERGIKYVSEQFMTEPTRFWEVAPETWRLVIDTNVVGPFLMARAAVPDGEGSDSLFVDQLSHVDDARQFGVDLLRHFLSVIRVFETASSANQGRLWLASLMILRCPFRKSYPRVSMMQPDRTG